MQPRRMARSIAGSQMRISRRGCGHSASTRRRTLAAWRWQALVTTNDERLAARIRPMRNYGQREKYEHIENRWKRASRYPSGGDAGAQAATRVVEPRPANAMRRTIGAPLADVEGGDLQFQQPVPDSTHVHSSLRLVQTARRDALRAHLAKLAISRRAFTIPRQCISRRPTPISATAPAIFPTRSAPRNAPQYDGTLS